MPVISVNAFDTDVELKTVNWLYMSTLPVQEATYSVFLAQIRKHLMERFGLQIKCMKPKVWETGSRELQLQNKRQDYML